MRSEQEVNYAIERYADMILRLCMVYLKNNSDAEDVFQSVFLKYTLHSGPFESTEHEKAWLLRVTSNACISLLRSPWRRFLNPIPASAPGHAEGQRLIELVHRLPPKHALVIHLHYYEDYSVKEIASILRISEGTVKSRLARARKQLGELIEKEEYLHG